MVLFSSKVYARLPTERPNPRTRHIDRRAPLAIARAINREDALVARAVGRQSRAIAQGMEILASCLRQKSTVLFLGAGDIYHLSDELVKNLKTIKHLEEVS